LSSALNKNPALKQQLDALPEEGQCVAGAALVAENNHQRGLLAAAKQAPGSSGFQGVSAHGRGSWMVGFKHRGKSASSRPYAPLLPADLFAMHTAFHSAALRSVCELN